MIMRIVVALALLASSCPMVAVPAAAQSSAGGGMTEEQILHAFQKQKTRGLIIAPSSQSGTTSGATTQAPPADSAAKPVNYSQLPKDEQVNVNIQFDFDSAVLRDDQKPKLVAVCRAIKSIDVPMFRIIGHTDASGTKAYNERLSKLRAEEVKRYLVSDCGLPASKLRAVGVGEDYLFDPANPRASVNRRVEFQVGS